MNQSQNNYYEVKKSAIELINNISLRIQKLINVESNNSTDTSIEKIFFIIEDMGILIEGVQYLIHEKCLDIDITEMNEKLSILLDAVEQKEFLLFQDILSFEMIPLLNFWSESISDV